MDGVKMNNNSRIVAVAAVLLAFVSAGLRSVALAQEDISEMIRNARAAVPRVAYARVDSACSNRLRPCVTVANRSWHREVYSPIFARYHAIWLALLI